jgi:hypothetical protein
MAVAVRRPAGGHPVRYPDIAVGRIDAPGAVGIEVFITDNFGRHIARGDGVVAAPVALA